MILGKTNFKFHVTSSGRVRKITDGDEMTGKQGRKERDGEKFRRMG